MEQDNWKISLKSTYEIVDPWAEDSGVPKEEAPPKPKRGKSLGRKAQVAQKQADDAAEFRRLMERARDALDEIVDPWKPDASKKR